MKKIIPFFMLFLLSCSSSEKDKEPIKPIVELTNEVLVYDADRISNNVILIQDASNNEVYLLGKDGKKVHEWSLSNKIGNDAYLENNGKLLAILKTDNDIIKFGGSGGQIQVINPDNTIDWQFTHSTANYNIHHDIQRLPNGNILAIVWERKTALEAKEKGFKGNHDIFIESIIEIEPSSKKIVWKWSSWNHLIQDVDSNKSNFTSIPQNPQLIDINYVTKKNGDIMHANAIEYDEKNDVILLSVNFYSEVWVIDHSTTTEQAKTNSGGNYKKGGNLVYRFGNPEASQRKGERLFYNNHHCNFIKNAPGEGNLLIYSNKSKQNSSSTVYELQLPSDYNMDKKPEVIWSFTDKHLASPKVSGAVRVENGNTIITEGDYGYWEITQDKKIAWLYTKQGFFWRGYPYKKDSEAIKNLTK